MDGPFEGKVTPMTRKAKTTRKALAATAIMTSTLALAISAGTAAAYAGPDSEKRTSTHTKNTQDKSVNMDARLLHFARSDELMGSDLHNTASESIGSLSDFIVDRGSGNIEFAIVKSGDILGFGGKSIAVPYHKLRYQPTVSGFSTNMTEEQLERQTEFIPENWEDLDNSNWLDSVSGWMNDDDIHHDDDSIREAVRRGDREEIEGRVTRVLRKTYKGDEHVFVIVQDDSGEQHNLILGPSWYVMGSENPINRDDEVEFSVVEYDTYYIVADGRVNNESVTYRDNKGRASWESRNSRTPARYILLSELEGMNAEVAGTTVGEVQTTLVEGGSGQVAMIALDPNENFFGLGDELSLVPWGAISLPRGSAMMINSNEAELERAMKMPDDVSTLRTPSSVSHAYKNFHLEMPSFEARDNSVKNSYGNRDRDSKRFGNAWGADSDLMEALRDGDKVTIRGKFNGFSNGRVVDGAPEARFLTVNTSDGTQRLIVAPGWFADRQNMRFDKGETLTIEAKRAEFNGREWITIISIENDDDEWTLWDNDAPAWTN